MKPNRYANRVPASSVEAMEIRGKVALVTGAGSGMGRELTLQLSSRGTHVAALDMRLESLKETAKLAQVHPGRVEIFEVDVTNSAVVASLPARIEEELGKVDILINNAGIIQPFKKILDLSESDIRKVMDVNFFGPLTLIKVFLPHLLERPEAHILNVSSMGAYAPVPGQSVYGASKAAIKLLTEGLRSELLDTRVGVTVVFPGAIATNIAANSGITNIGSPESAQQAFPMTSAADAARAMIEAIEKNKPRVVIGKDARMLDIVSRINPVYAAKLIYKQMSGLLKG